MDEEAEKTKDALYDEFRAELTALLRRFEARFREEIPHPSEARGTFVTGVGYGIAQALVDSSRRDDEKTLMQEAETICTVVFGWVDSANAVQRSSSLLQ